MPVYELPITLQAPDSLSSYLSDSGDSEVIHWSRSLPTENNYQPWARYLAGDYDFGVHGWSASGTGTASKDYTDYAHVITTVGVGDSLVYDKLVIASPGDPNALIDFDTEIADNDTGNTVEIVLKLTNATVGWAFVTIADEKYQETVFIESTGVGVVSASDGYAMDTTDAYHRYTIVTKGNVLHIYVDGILRFESGFYLASTGKKVSFGNNLDSNITSKWKYIKYGKFQAQPIAKDVMDFEVLVDTTNTFDSINLQTYTYSTYTGEKYLSQFCAGMVIPKLARRTESEYTYYWKVRHTGSTYTSAWSEIQEFKLDRNTTDIHFNNMLSGLADENVYTKAMQSGNIAALFKGSSSEVDVNQFSAIRLKRDVSFLKGRDASEGVIAGALFGIDRTTASNIIEYRRQIAAVVNSFIKASTTKAIKNYIKTVTGVEPGITEQFRQNAWILKENAVDAPHYYLPDSNYPTLSPTIQLFSEKGSAFIWQLHLFNPYGISYNTEQVELLVNKLKPIHTEVYFIYYNEEGGIILRPDYYGEAYYGLSIYTDSRYTL